MTGWMKCTSLAAAIGAAAIASRTAAVALLRSRARSATLQALHVQTQIGDHPLGRISLRNRLIMAPMTRNRATAEHVPTAIMADYYGERASMGLIVTEGVAPSADGAGYARIPGLYNAEQVEAWKPVTRAVHDAGGRIFAQLMHTGRASHLDNMPAGTRVISAAALALGMLMIPFSSSLPWLLAAMVFVAFGFSLVSPSLNSLISLQVDADVQGGTMGITRSTTTLARVLGPGWAGAMFHFLGKDWPFLGGAVVMAAVVLLSLRTLSLSRRSRR